MWEGNAGRGGGIAFLKNKETKKTSISDATASSWRKLKGVLTLHTPVISCVKSLITVLFFFFKSWQLVHWTWKCPFLWLKTHKKRKTNCKTSEFNDAKDGNKNYKRIRIVAHMVSTSGGLELNTKHQKKDIKKRTSCDTSGKIPIISAKKRIKSIRSPSMLPLPHVSVTDVLCVHLSCFWAYSKTTFCLHPLANQKTVSGEKRGDLKWDKTQNWPPIISQ